MKQILYGVTLILSVLWCTACTQTNHEVNSEIAIKEITDSTVFIWNAISTKKDPTSSLVVTGTGILMNSSSGCVVITASHVINPTGEPLATGPVIGVNFKADKYDKTNVATTEVVGDHVNGYDLASLKIVNCRGGSHVKGIRVKPLDKGEAVYSIANPGGSYDRAWTYIGGVVSNTSVKFASSPATFVLVQMPVEGGCSGAGLFDKDGNLVGIVVSMINNNFAYAVSAQSIIEWGIVNNVQAITENLR